MKTDELGMKLRDYSLFALLHGAFDENYIKAHYEEEK